MKFYSILLREALKKGANFMTSCKLPLMTPQPPPLFMTNNIMTSISILCDPPPHRIYDKIITFVFFKGFT